MIFVEIEQKYRVRKPASVLAVLKKLRARKIRSGFEKNELFDWKGMLREKKSILRLRQNGKKKQGLLTFKGPRMKGRYKKRVEIETTVDHAVACRLLKNIGFQQVAAYSKRREEFVLGPAHVMLDYLKGHGWFLEIEAAPKTIASVEKQLGLSRQDREERTYLEILSGPGAWIRD